MNIGIHNLLCGGIPLRCSIKSRAAVHILRLCGQHVQRTFRVGKPCLFCHADQCGCTGQCLKAAGATAGTARGICCIKNYHMSGFGGGAGVACQQFSVQYNSCANAGTQSNDNRTLCAFSAARKSLAQCSNICIITNGNRQTCLLRQIFLHCKIMPI